MNIIDPVCPNCGGNDFYPYQYRLGQFYRCRICMNDRRKRHRQTTRGKQVNHQQMEKRRQMIKAFVNALKSSTPCADCHKYFPAVCMDFDHLDGTLKSDNIATLVHYRRSIELIKTEISKCEIVCSNCHRLRTENRRKTCHAA